MSWEISLFILGFAALLFVLCAIPTLIQVRRTARNAGETLGLINEKLPAVLENLQHTSENFHKTTEAVRSAQEGIQHVVGELREIKRQALQLQRRLGDVFTPPAIPGSGRMKKAFAVAFVANRLIRLLRSP
jgi:uncharacterized protein YoxC